VHVGSSIFIQNLLQFSATLLQILETEKNCRYFINFYNDSQDALGDLFQIILFV